MHNDSSSLFVAFLKKNPVAGRAKNAERPKMYVAGAAQGRASQAGARSRALWLLIRLLKNTPPCQDAAQLQAVQSKLLQNGGAPGGTTFRRGLCRA